MKKENIHLRSEIGFKDTIKNACKKTGLTVTEFIIQSINEKIERGKEIRAKVSGKTFVTRNKGIDYLCINPKEWNMGCYELISSLNIKSIWKQFSEVEVSDVFSDLNPVISDNEISDTVFYIREFDIRSSNDKDTIEYKYYLATVDDL